MKPNLVRQLVVVIMILVWSVQEIPLVAGVSYDKPKKAGEIASGIATKTVSLIETSLAGATIASKSHSLTIKTLPKTKSSPLASGTLTAKRSVLPPQTRPKAMSAPLASGTIIAKPPVLTSSANLRGKIGPVKTPPATAAKPAKPASASLAKKIPLPGPMPGKQPASKTPKIAAATKSIVLSGEKATAVLLKKVQPAHSFQSQQVSHKATTGPTVLKIKNEPKNHVPTKVGQYPQSSLNGPLLKGGTVGTPQKGVSRPPSASVIAPKVRPPPQSPASSSRVLARPIMASSTVCLAGVQKSLSSSKILNSMNPLTKSLPAPTKHVPSPPPATVVAHKTSPKDPTAHRQVPTKVGQFPHLKGVPATDGQYPKSSMDGPQTHAPSMAFWGHTPHRGDRTFLEGGSASSSRGLPKSSVATSTNHVAGAPKGFAFQNTKLASQNTLPVHPPIASRSAALPKPGVASHAVASGSTRPLPASLTADLASQASSAVEQLASKTRELDENGVSGPKVNISGTKTFEMKKADVKGDVGHFSTENFDSIPGFHLDQSMHLEVDGNLSQSTKVTAVLDDKEDEERRFTVFAKGRLWNMTLGDFPVALKDTELTLAGKEVRGVWIEGNPQPRLKTMFLYSRSKGLARREQFRGAGQQQEFRLTGKPIVQNSERILIDGRLLTRGTEYLIDFEDGILKLQPRLLPIEITSWIVVEYEVSDANLAFKRNLMGTRWVYEFPDKGRLGMTYLREADDALPQSEVPASGTVRPMDHRIWGFDGLWHLNDVFKIGGETSFSGLDPNTKSDLTSQDKEVKGAASRLTLTGKGEKIDGEVSRRRVEKDFKLVGRESGAMELGERGLVNDILKENGRFNYTFNQKWSGMVGMENSKTNLSKDPALSAIDFKARNGGVTWKYGEKSQVVARIESQFDREDRTLVLSDREKRVGALVWDHDFGGIFTQSKVERTTYDDSVNIASGSKVTNALLSLGSDLNKKFAWNVSAGHVNLEDGLMHDGPRSKTQNYGIDLNYEPNRVFKAQGILQWRQEKDFLMKTDQNDEVADSRIQFRPTPDLRTQAKLKIENTTKVVRDPSLDPTKFIRPPSLPLDPKNQVDLVGSYTNPVQKRTANYSTNYRIGEKGEANFDWKVRDVKDRYTSQTISFNDRKTYEFRFTPKKKWRLLTEYEDGVARNIAPKTQLQDSVKRVGISNEFREGYVVETKYEDRCEDDVYVNDNDKTTVSKSLDFQRVFSRKATFELGIQRNVIEFKQPSREWEKRASLVLTPSARNQRYKFFVSHKDIQAIKSGTHLEGGVNFSQFIGTDSIIDGEVKKVRSSAGIAGSGYDSLVANAKMVITF